ncbi:sugar ABC transporter permease [Streptomyces sp. ME19-01-6]|uniref:carbohydrate ABC transporter permease n=1 Tax=Streptomyces sp. ME19-01-6 TaxID=3028686 RepID=UPI0029B58346|nr:sugar ABC transporter permease [Streptomyces sp. ME19-01-6]MDX3231785.1 sugar ABC transporter permease [Streptomyces sp. ME19-01-6]
MTKVVDTGMGPSSPTRPTARQPTTDGPGQAPGPSGPRRWRSYLASYLAISPFFVLFAVFGVFPLGIAAYLSLHTWDGIGTMHYVGFEQFQRLLDDTQFWQSVVTTIEIFVMSQAPMIVAALVAAFVLSSDRLRLRGVYQTVYFLPQATSVVVIAIVFQSLFGSNFGLINRLLVSVGLPSVDWMASTWGANTVIALMIIWRGFGYLVIFFMAGMATIPAELYEAAELDGAGGARKLWSITLPMLRPTVVFALVTGVVGGLQVFTEPQILDVMGTSVPGMTMMLLQYQYIGQSQSAGVNPDLGYASAIGWAVFALVALASLGTLIMRRVTGHKEAI